jgi:general secretion pathway protein G
MRPKQQFRAAVPSHYAVEVILLEGQGLAPMTMFASLRGFYAFRICPPTRLPPRYARLARSAGDQRGFTLIELLVVIAILSLLIGLVAPAMIRQLGSAKHKIAEQSIARIGGILDIYRIDIGSYPTTQQSLQALVVRPSNAAGWNGPYVKDPDELNDPWGRLYQYRNPSTRPGHDYDIISLGADGKPGGDGEDADIENK